MNRLALAIMPLAIISTACSGPSDDRFVPEHTLWYESPADAWEETLPLGNGRLGMMPDGEIREECIILNEISLWSGSEADYANPDAAESLPLIREMLLEGRNAEAQEVMYERFVPDKPSDGGTYGGYQVLGGLFLSHHTHSSLSDSQDSPFPYRRWLDLRTATASTVYTIDSTEFRRSYHVDREADVMTVSLSASDDEAICFDMRMIRHRDVSMELTEEGWLKISGELDSGA